MPVMFPAGDTKHAGPRSQSSVSEFSVSRDASGLKPTFCVWDEELCILLQEFQASVTTLVDLEGFI